MSFRIILLLLFLLIGPLPCFSCVGMVKDSTERKYEVSIKINNHWNFYTDFYPVNDRRYDNGVLVPINRHWASEFGNQSVGIQFFNRKNHTSHEIDLRNFYLSSFYYANRRKGSNSDISIAYQFNYYLSNSNKALMMPYAGILLLTNFRLYKSENLGNNSFSNRSSIGLAAQVNIVPGLKYNLSDRVYFDLSVPINIFRGSYYYFANNYKNGIDVIQQELAYADWFSGFNKHFYQVRFGAGVNIHSKNRWRDAEKYLKSLRVNFNFANNLTSKDNYPILRNDLASITFQNKNFKNLIHEISLPGLIGNWLGYSGGIDKRHSYYLRYQLSYLFLNESEVLVNPYFGLAYLIGYSKQGYSSYSGKYFSSSSNSWSHTYYINPGFQIYPNSKTYIDVCVPLDVFRWGINNSKDYDLATPGSAEKYIEIRKRSSYSYLPEWHTLNIRIGIGVRL